MAKMNSYQKDIEQIYTQKLPWDKLSGSNILITGATGLIGGCLVDVLMNNPNCDYTVFASGRNEERAFLRFSKYLNRSNFKFLKFDVADPITCDYKLDYIIHAASNANPKLYVQQPVEVMMGNIFGVNNLITYGMKHDMKRFLFVSSGEIYGEGDGRVFDENYSGYVDSTNPRSCYPSSKRAAETLCVCYSKEYGIDVTIARPCHIYGPYFTESDNRVYAQFIRNILNNEDVVMKSAGSQFRSWCYVVDCASALLFILLKGENGQAYNIADNNTNISIRELAEIVAGIGGKKVIFENPTDSEQRGYNLVTKSVFSIDKLASLGWTLSGTIQEKLLSTIEVYK